jgi:hypothetical protein
MKSNRCKIFLLILTACLYTLTGSFAQDLVSPILSVKYIKLTDNSKKILITLQAKEDRKMVQIENGKIAVYALIDTTRFNLGELLTNYKGEASLTIGRDRILPTDKIGNTKVVADYFGSAKYSKASSDLVVKDVFLDVQLSKDSSKSISAFVYELNNKGEKVFIKDVDIVFNVKRLFCLFPIGTAKTDPAGNCSTVFPSDIPGDTSGKLDIVVRIQDNDSYATVEKIQSATWGKPVIIEHKTKRGLGDTDAPLWMVYTLLVLLSGVWVHFIYVLILIFRIDKIGKRLLRADTVNNSDNR